MTPDDLGITREQCSNLKKLADILETVDEDSFDMRDYVVPVEGCLLYTSPSPRDRG